MSKSTDNEQERSVEQPAVETPQAEYSGTQDGTPSDSVPGGVINVTLRGAGIDDINRQFDELNVSYLGATIAAGAIARLDDGTYMLKVTITPKQN